jgi:hypothetical protein
MKLTDWEVVALGVLAGLHEQNQNTSNPMLAELEPVSGVNSRWAAAVAGLLMFAAVAYEEPKPAHQSQAKTPAGETTKHAPWAFIDR